VRIRAEQEVADFVSEDVAEQVAVALRRIETETCHAVVIDVGVGADSRVVEKGLAEGIFRVDQGAGKKSNREMRRESDAAAGRRRVELVGREAGIAGAV